MATKKKGSAASTTLTARDGSTVPAFAVRALSNQNRLTVGPWMGDMRKGTVYVVPVEVARHLRDHDIVVLVDAETAEDDEWFDQTAETDAELAARVRAQLIGAVDDPDDPNAEESSDG